MKHSELDDLVPLYVDLAETLAAPLPAVRLAELTDWLAPAAHRLGLTNYPTPLQLATHLISPALYILSANTSLHLKSPSLDFGAGSCAVGLALALCTPGTEVLLADRRRRVVDFGDLAIKRYGIHNCRSLLADLGNPPTEWQKRCGSALIRAYGPADQALDQAVAWLAPAGTMCLWHQPPAPTPPDGSRHLATGPTNLPSLLLSIYQCP